MKIMNVECNIKAKIREIECYANQRGITLVALIITIILMLILAGVVLNLTIGENGIIGHAKQATQKYEIEEIREKVEMGIMNVVAKETALENEVTIEKVLQELLKDGTFENIDKSEKLGYIGEYEVKLKYDESQNVIIEYIQKITGVKTTYKLEPIGYTNEEKVSILFTVMGKVKNVTKPNGLVLTSQGDKVEINYQVDKNGKYEFLVESEDGTKITKEVIVDTIDKLPPLDFEIIPEETITGIKINAKAEDAETDGISVKSGIERYEYYIKKSTETSYKKYETNEINDLTTGTYKVYVIAYDKAGNDTISSEIEIKITAKFSKVSAGAWYSLAIDESGNLWSWGSNDKGQLGDNTTTNRTKPVQIKKGTLFKEVSAGYDHSLAIDIDGHLWAWGNNEYGKLGNNSTTISKEPILIKEETVFKKIATGKEHSLAIDEEGNLWAWGNNKNGRLGDNTTTNRTKPVQIKIDTKFKEIATQSGYGNYRGHSLAIDEEGNLWAWGANTYGQIGDGSTTHRKEPVQIKKGTLFKEISAGDSYSIVIDEEGNSWAWGNNGGMFGNGLTTSTKTPTQTNKEILFEKISLWNFHSLAIDERGNLWSWGSNGSGVLGDGSTTDRKEPVQIKKGTLFKEISAGYTHSLAIDESGNLWSWGSNDKGQLGDGTTTPQKLPIQLF